MHPSWFAPFRTHKKFPRFAGSGAMGDEHTSTMSLSPGILGLSLCTRVHEHEPLVNTFSEHERF